MKPDFWAKQQWTKMFQKQSFVLGSLLNNNITEYIDFIIETLRDIFMIYRVYIYIYIYIT